MLFDNDGILVDTEKLYWRANRETLADLGIELSEADYVEISLRAGRGCLELAREQGASDADVERLRRERDGLYHGFLEEGVSVLAGVHECLAALHGRFPLAIVTSAPLHHFAVVHERTGLLDYFEFALTPDQYGSHKPHPEPYRVAAGRLLVDPAHCLAVEDSERGLRSAHAAGMRCAVVPHGLTRGQDFADAVAVLDGLAQLPGLVAELSG